MGIDDVTENGAIRVRLGWKFGDREISMRRFQKWGPFGLKIFGKLGKSEKTEKLYTKNPKILNLEAIYYDPLSIQ